MSLYKLRVTSAQPLQAYQLAILSSSAAIYPLNAPYHTLKPPKKSTSSVLPPHVIFYHPALLSHLFQSTSPIPLNYILLDTYNQALSLVFPPKTFPSSISLILIFPLPTSFLKVINQQPCCPIVSFYHSPTESLHVDSHLQSTDQYLPSYIKDTNNFLTMLCSFPIPLHYNILLVTIVLY